MESLVGSDVQALGDRIFLKVQSFLIMIATPISARSELVIPLYRSRIGFHRQFDNQNVNVATMWPTGVADS